MIRTSFVAFVAFAALSIVFSGVAFGHGEDHEPSPFDLSNGPAAGGAEPNYLYPDVVPFVREDEPYLQNWDISGTELRLETVYANFGDGLFEIRSGPEIGNDQIEVLQRVYIDNDFGGVFEDFVIGAAVAHHQEHGHIHFEEFSRFSLHEMTVDNGVIGVGDEVASSLKSSFRLSANANGANPLLPEYVGYPNYTSSNNGLQQRISVGYGDRYSRLTAGQSLSIDGLPVGPLYWIRQHVDPNNHVLETDETNNVFEILVDLNKQGEALFRPDDTFVQPGDASSVLPTLFGDLNDDWDINGADWTIFIAALHTDYSGVPPEEWYQHGDLNDDGLTTYADFTLLRGAFEDFNGAGSFNAMLNGLPEPSALVLFALGCATLLIRRRR